MSTVSRLPDASRHEHCVAKTHFPFLPASGHDTAAKPSRLLVLVRNPVDIVAAAYRYYLRKAEGASLVLRDFAMDKMVAKYMYVEHPVTPAAVAWRARATRRKRLRSLRVS